MNFICQHTYFAFVFSWLNIIIHATIIDYCCILHTFRDLM